MLGAGALLVAGRARISLGKAQDNEMTRRLAAGEWPAYGGTNLGARYSPLAQIDETNVAQLRVAWTWESPDQEILKANPDLPPGEFQATPIMLDGVLYTSTAMCQVAAIDAVSGRTLWVYDSGNWRHRRTLSKGFQHRGVAYWADGDDKRIFIGTGDNQLIALDAKTGRPVPGFGVGGIVDLTSVGLQRRVESSEPLWNVMGCTSAPLICRDILVIGHWVHDREVNDETMPPGDVRGFDVRTGALEWTFHTIPVKGEYGHDTWLDDSAGRNGNTNIWAPMTADDELGLVYLPGSCPTNNFYGGKRPGDNLFGSSLIAIEAVTGKRRWHFQFVHHDVWDYDLPCAPTLLDVTVAGKRVKAVAQATKQGMLFVFDRVTGEPLWPIVERPVPQSTINGERTSPTQPFTTRPAPFEDGGISEADLIDFTPEINAAARDILEAYDAGPLYTPYSSKPTITRPAWTGGANWPGVAADPETGMIYIPSQNTIAAMALDQNGNRTAGSNETSEMAGAARAVEGPNGMPLTKPPYSRITAIDLNTGEHVWMKPNGPGATDSPQLEPFNLGWIGSRQRAGPLLTKTLLFVGEGPHDPRYGKKVLRAYDKMTGEMIAEIALPSFTIGPPMTYMASGKQFIVCGMGIRRDPHRLVALALP